MSDPTDRAPGPPDPEAAPSITQALNDRWQAEAARWTTIVEIALTETRLAGSSALALLGIALAGAVLAPVCWLLLMALVTLGLVGLGMGMAMALSLVLLAHLLGAAVLVWLARRLMGNLRFGHTLDALGRTRRRAEPSGTAAEAPEEPAAGRTLPPIEADAAHPVPRHPPA